VAEKIILGIDPGTTIMGFGLIKVIDKKIELMSYDELLLSKLSDPYLKLKRIFEKTLSIIDNFNPDEIAIEAPFYGKNVQSMLKLGRAQGVAMAAGLYRQIPITEYSPKKIKMAVTGNGNASKEQVAGMLVRMLNMKEMPKHLDATDGLAAAVCHYFNAGVSSESTKSYGSWKAFVSQNKTRVKK
jgi:crossover junction endodeoxyribonuclease RuvC